MNFDDPLPTLQDSLIGLSFQFGSGGQANPGSAKASGGASDLGGNTEMRHLLDQVLGQQDTLAGDLGSLSGQYSALDTSFGNLSGNFDTLNQQLKNIYGF